VSTLLPYLVLLPVGFTEPGRSPGLLVSSYLTVSPLPRPPSKDGRGGLFSVALSLLDQIERWALSTTAPCGVRTFLPGMTPVAVDSDRGHAREESPDSVGRGGG